jgi:PKHD-type hydroxylase
MILCIDQLLSAGDSSRIDEILVDVPFADGASTAGWAARGVKNNVQAEPGAACAAIAIVQSALLSSDTFIAYSAPLHFGPMIVSRYTAGMYYGPHVDDAVMGNPPMRTDLAFTLFLSEPDSYDGGELVIDEAGREQWVKLDRGCLVVYPAASLHWVNPVKSGVRIVVVGWLQSLLRDPRQREILYDLQLARHAIFATYGKTEIFDHISKTSSNLWRMWAEP